MLRKKKGVQRKVLCVGLGSDISKELLIALQSDHFDVACEANPKKAFRLIQAKEIPIVLFDQQTDKMEAATFVKKASKLISHPTIIVLTHKKSAQNIRTLFHDGAHDCLIKPFQMTHLVQSIAKGIERRKAKVYGIKDPLTGLFNRYAFKDNLKSEIIRAQRYDRHLSLLMVDIDYFKKINDEFGHITGDQVLVELSGILSKAFRKTDIITRFGGEEFAIILPETTIGHATMLAERIRKHIQEYDFSRLIGKRKITVSIGISNHHTPGEKATQNKNDLTLIHSADQALYAAKKEGRNKVCISVPKRDRRLTT